MEGEIKCCCTTKAGEPWIPHYMENIDPAVCEACELCVRVCPRKVIEMDLVKGKVVAVPKREEHCIGDGNCCRICPYGAITLKPK